MWRYIYLSIVNTRWEISNTHSEYSEDSCDTHLLLFIAIFHLKCTEEVNFQVQTIKFVTVAWKVEGL